MLSVWAVGFVHTAVASLLYVRAGEGVVFVYFFLWHYTGFETAEKKTW